MRKRLLNPFRFACCVTVWSLTAASLTAADSMRCGTKLISDGELAIQVREKCGDPVSEELIGYTLRGAPPGFRGNREYKIEQWVYGPEQGYYRVLVFEAGRLHDIDRVRQ